MDLDIINKWAKEIGLMSDTEFEENYKYIETLLNRRKQALRIHDVVGRSEQCEHDYQPCKHEAVSEFDECTKCGKIN
jgi:sporulation protein YlmC with PRC-barrel domain